MREAFALARLHGDKPFVEVKTGPTTFERKNLKVGISDGIRIEVIEGIDEDAEIKVPVLGAPGGK